MADEILTLPDARRALRLKDTDTSNDADLTDTYLPATTEIVEDLIGAVMEDAGRVLIADGGAYAITLPDGVTAVTQVVEGGLTLAAEDYYVPAGAASINRGQPTAPLLWATGATNIQITYTAGAYALPQDVPRKITLAARIILRHIWQADQQGNAQGGRNIGNVNTDVVGTPSGFLIPRRAFELLHRDLLLPGIA